MEFKKIKKKEESRTHKIRSAMRFLNHLYDEIKLAKSLEDIQDKIILDKFKEYILILEEEIKE